MKNTVRNAVSQYRDKAELTQQELAEKDDVTRQTIHALEKGNYTLSVALALRLAKVFNCRVEDLFKL